MPNPHLVKSLYTITLLLISNLFMTFAWYGHLQFKKISWLHGLGLVGVILVSWGLAFFEYVFQVPANRIGFEENGGPFSLFQLKVIQEVVSLTVFTLCAVYVFKTDKLAWNHVVGFALLVAAVYVIFKKW
ncbi:DMT family protein [Hymenobacter tenuis]